MPLKQVMSEVVQKANDAAQEAAEAEEGDEEAKQEADAEAKAEEEEAEEEYLAERGWWVHRKSREPLGGQDGRLDFTLVGSVRLFPTSYGGG